MLSLFYSQLRVFVLVECNFVFKTKQIYFENILLFRICFRCVKNRFQLRRGLPQLLIFRLSYSIGLFLEKKIRDWLFVFSYMISGYIRFNENVKKSVSKAIENEIARPIRRFISHWRYLITILPVDCHFSHLFAHSIAMKTIESYCMWLNSDQLPVTFT